jgi:hypothetical protein
MEQNKTGKYLKYAIGEVVLVVIGILIAISINSWNENRISRNKEILLLKELNNEFKLNKIQLDSAIYYHKRALNSAESIMSKFPIDSKTINLDSLGIHSFYMNWYYTFDPSEGIINALTNSSSYDLISNNDLRKLLISWSDVLENYQEEEIIALNNFMNHLKPYIKKHTVYGWENYRDWFKDPRLDLSFLETLEYENFVRDRHSDISEIVSPHSGELELITKTIDQIIELSEPKSND